MLQDKMAIMQVLAGLMHNPSLLTEIDKYKLENIDFPERFHSILFGAINNLYHDGVESIDSGELISYLKDYNLQYEIFKKNDGERYINKLKELYEDNVFKPENFDYYYERLKKFTLLREMRGLGFDVKDVYDDSILNPREREKMLYEFDQMDIQDILKVYESKLIAIQDKFDFMGSAQSIHASEGIDSLLEELQENPEIGLPLSSRMLTSISRGARKGTFYIRSSYSGGGKTRHMMNDAVNLSSRELYDLNQEKWVENPFPEQVNSVLISTELTPKELQQMAIAKISGVDEERLKWNEISEEERERVIKAGEVLKQSGLYFEYLPNFDIETIKRVVMRNIIRRDVGYVFFDYIHTSVEMLSSFSRQSGVSLREDQVLYMMSSGLKQIATDYDIFLMSATQLNDNYKEAQRRGEDIDFQTIRGAKSIVDKADLLCIMLPPTKKELKETEAISRELSPFPYTVPNIVCHVSKNRGNKHDKIKIFSYQDLGTMQITDLFATNFDNEPVNIREVVYNFEE